MITINKAIMHTMDAQEQRYHLSSEELILSIPVCEYMMKHIEKIIHANNAQKGIFKVTSKLYKDVQAYQSEHFIELTRSIANTWFTAYMEALRYMDMNLLFVEYREEDTLYLAVMLFKNKPGFIRSITKEGNQVRNEIITYSSILPSFAQNIDEFFIINLTNYEILLKEKKTYMNGEEELLVSDSILYCDIEMSMKDTVQTIQNIVMKVSHELDADPLENTLKVKKLLKSCVDTNQHLEVSKICPVAFPEHKAFEEKFDALVLEAKVPKNINLQAKTPVGIRKHKIRTDAGIEINIPVDYANSKETFNIIDNSDGTVTIELKHVGKILEK